MTPTPPLWHGVWERLQGDPHSPPPPGYSQRRFRSAPCRNRQPCSAQRGKIPGSATGSGPGVQPGREAAAPGARRVGPAVSPPVPPPRLSAAQSGRGSGARCGQSGAAGAAPGAGGRGASPESGSRGGAAIRRERAESRAAGVDWGASGRPSRLCRGYLPADPRDPAGGVTGNRAPRREGERVGESGAPQVERAGSGQGAGRPRGPSAAGAARFPPARRLLSAGARGGATFPHAAGVQEW